MGQHFWAAEMKNLAYLTGKAWIIEEEVEGEGQGGRKREAEEQVNGDQL